MPHAHLNCLAIHGRQHVARPHAFPVDHVLTGCNDEVDLHQQSSQVTSSGLMQRHHHLGEVGKRSKSVRLMCCPQTTSSQTCRRCPLGYLLVDGGGLTSSAFCLANEGSLSSYALSIISQSVQQRVQESRFSQLKRRPFAIFATSNFIQT